MIKDFDHPVDTWIKALEQYDFVDLCTRPSPDSWSLGQVYMHLIEDTRYYLEQIRICVTNNDNTEEEAAPFAKSLFLNNDFPDEVIEGAPTNVYIPQPGSKEQLMDNLTGLKEEIKKAELMISHSPFKGKTKHPGLQYFSADEWFRFAEMHFRHHLRQKKRIDEFLK